MYKLILVDDEPMIAELLSSAYDWNSYGFDLVASFTSGEEVIKYMETHPVDVLITDVKMPKISGIDLAKYCCEQHPDVAVLLLSAHRDFEYARQALSYKVLDYLLKPINDESFAQSMQKLHDHLDAQERILNRPSDYSKNMIINEAVSYIRENYKENLTADMVAKHVMISPEYFGVYFKKHYGENFVDFLRKVRMEAALEFLKDDSLTVASISEMVGYKSTTHFYENFQNCYGQTPASYRKALKKKGTEKEC